MKYPQLVSSRAVSEISDWLIRRLEDLDIEQPSVYSRLLLSLLHTPFKLNAVDLLEIPQLKDLKQPYHLLNKNNEELKRIAAVESLMEVSSKENKSNIISLVDELHLKLRKVESSCEENAIIGRSSNVAVPTSPVTSTNSKFYKNLKKIKRNHGAENPTKNYYLAFPALSSKKTTTTITSGGCKSSSSGEVNEKKKDSNLQLLTWSNMMNAKDNNTSRPITSTVDNEKFRAAVKPRRKRRYGRNIKSFNNVQCNAKSYEDATLSPKVKNASKKHQRNQYVMSNGEAARNNNLTNAPNMDFSSGSGQWDMDFKGHWEMDRDLIGEFIQEQEQGHEPELEVESANQVEPSMEDEDDFMLMKFLPMKLMDDDPNYADAARYVKAKEAQSISSLKSKFDANVRALWNDVEDPSKPLTHKNYDEGSASLVNSFASDKNSLSLFNFFGHQPFTQEVVAPIVNNQIFGTNYLRVGGFDNGGNYGSQGDVYKSHQSSSNVSPGTEKFIKLGTNVQGLTSIWSDGDFSCEPENLISKDVVDHCDDAIYKQMKTIGAEMKIWQKSSLYDEEITLFNHSEEASAFKRFRSVIVPTVIRASYHPKTNQKVDRTIVEPSEESDLMSSDRTHFTPLTPDGHIFCIDPRWEDIKYERSADGELIYNNKRYKEWTHTHHVNDEGSFCTNDSINLDSIENDAKEEFTVKFMIEDENDKGCQTEPAELMFPNRNLEINEDYCKRKIYDEYFKKNNEDTNKWRYHLNADDSNDYSFFSVNRVKNNDAVNSAMKKEQSLKTLQELLVSPNSSSSSICTITSSSQLTAAVDPFESWRNIKVEQGDMLISNYKKACMHSLWEQCLTCNRYDLDVEQSIPANGQLKDELRMDGDEIMNVIQNLYITGDFCEDEEKEDVDCEDMNHFYIDMCDDSMDGCCAEENKFYESEGKRDDNVKKAYTPNLFEQQQREELLQLDSIVTMAKMQWQWDETREMEKDQEKYKKLLSWIQASLSKEVHQDSNNNNCHLSNEDHRPKNRKRRHSTCQNFMEKKTYRSQDLEFPYLNNSQSPTTAAFMEENANLLADAAKMLKVNIDKILLVADMVNGSGADQCKDENGYYRNILQQQHALIKQMDLARPLTR